MLCVWWAGVHGHALLPLCTWHIRALLFPSQAQPSAEKTLSCSSKEGFRARLTNLRCKTIHCYCNLVPRPFSSFKMVVGETPGQGCQSGSKNSLEFRHANTMKCLRFVWITVSDCRKQTGPPDAGNNLWKSHFIMCHVTKYSTIREVFQQPGPGGSPTAILNEEKALGTRLLLLNLWSKQWLLLSWGHTNLLNYISVVDSRVRLFSSAVNFPR